jgi:hypothetical protein
MTTHRLVALLASACLVLAAAPATATDKARIAVIGDVDTLQVGQSGYCGARVAVDRAARQSIFVTGDQRVWLYLKYAQYSIRTRVSCDGDFSFVPQTGNAYIVRNTLNQDDCVVELFRVVPGGDPVRENLTPEQGRPCLSQ